MNYIEDLMDLSGSEKHAVANTANKAIKYTKALETGHISQDEYEELMYDLVAEKNLARFADDLETQAKIEQAITALIMVARAAS